MPRAKRAEVTCSLPMRLHAKVVQILEARGSTFDDFVRLQCLRLTKNEKFYDLTDKLTFGKYRGELIETVIRGDPEYMIWCLKNVTGFGLTPEALGILEETGVDFE